MTIALLKVEGDLGRLIVESMQNADTQDGVDGQERDETQQNYTETSSNICR